LDRHSAKLLAHYQTREDDDLVPAGFHWTIKQVLNSNFDIVIDNFTHRNLVPYSRNIKKDIQKTICDLLIRIVAEQQVSEPEEQSDRESVTTRDELHLSESSTTPGQSDDEAGVRRSLIVQPALSIVSERSYQAESDGSGLADPEPSNQEVEPFTDFSGTHRAPTPQSAKEDQLDFQLSPALSAPLETSNPYGYEAFTQQDTKEGAVDPIIQEVEEEFQQARRESQHYRTEDLDDFDAPGYSSPGFPLAFPAVQTSNRPTATVPFTENPFPHFSTTTYLPPTASAPKSSFFGVPLTVPTPRPRTLTTPRSYQPSSLSQQYQNFPRPRIVPEAQQQRALAVEQSVFQLENTILNISQTFHTATGSPHGDDPHSSHSDKSDDNDQPEATIIRPKQPPPNGDGPTPPHPQNMGDKFKSMGAAFKAVKEAGIPTFAAKLAPKETMEAELSFHKTMVEDFFHDTYDGDGAAQMNLVDTAENINHGIRLFKAIVSATWTGKACEYYGREVTQGHAMILNANNQGVGLSYPPATMDPQRYTHPRNLAAGDQVYAGYKQQLEMAQARSVEWGETPRYSKIDWRDAKYDGTPDKLNGWEQTIEAVAKANNIQHPVPAPYGAAVCNAIAARFFDLAAETWAKENNKPMQLFNVLDNQGQITERGLIQWARDHFLSVAWITEKHNELMNIQWDSKKETLVRFNERFKNLLSEAGQDKAAAKLQREWYISSLPPQTARRVRSAIADFINNESERGRLADPTLRYTMDSAVHHRSNQEAESRTSAMPSTPRSANYTSNQRNNNNNTNRPRTQPPAGQRTDTNRNSGNTERNNEVTCYQCQKKGHIARDCPQQGRNIKCQTCGIAHPYGKHIWDGNSKNNSKTRPARRAKATKPTNDKKKPKAEQPTKQDTKDDKYEALHCEAELEGQPIKLLVDTGTSMAAITKNTLQKLGKTITHPSHLLVNTISGEEYHVLGEVHGLLLELEGAQFKVNAFVTEAKDFDMAIGWDFIRGHFGIVSALNMVLILRKDGDVIEVPLNDGINSPTLADAEDEHEYEDHPVKHIHGRYAHPWGDPAPSARASPGPICYELAQWVEQLSRRFKNSPHRKLFDNAGCCPIKPSERPKKFEATFSDWRTGNTLGAAPHQCGSTSWSGARDGYLPDSCHMCAHYRKLCRWAKEHPNDTYYETCTCLWCEERRQEQAAEPEEPQPPTKPQSRHRPSPNQGGWGKTTASRAPQQSRASQQSRRPQQTRQPQHPRQPPRPPTEQLPTRKPTVQRTRWTPLQPEQLRLRKCTGTPSKQGCYRWVPENEFMSGCQRCDQCRYAQAEKNWQAKQAAQRHTAIMDTTMSVQIRTRQGPSRPSRGNAAPKQKRSFNRRGVGTAGSTTRH